MTIAGKKSLRTHSILLIFQTLIFSCVTSHSPDPIVTQQWLKDDNANRMRIHSETSEIRSKFESQKYVNPLIWRVEYKERISYLFGTMHVSIRSNEIPFDIHKHLDAANTVVFEVDPNDQSKVTFHNKSVGQGPCLDKTLSSTAWKNLKYDLLVIDVEEFRCLDADDAHDLWEAFQFAKLIKGEPLLDLELLKESQRNQKKTVFLETADEAMNALIKSKAKTNASQNNDLKTFNDILEGDRVQIVIDSYKSLYEIGIAYKDGNLTKLETLLSDFDYLDYKEIITNRNLNWLPKLKTLFVEGQAFVAVGVGHMMGPGSLLPILEKEGFVITKLSLKDL